MSRRKLKITIPADVAAYTYMQLRALDKENEARGVKTKSAYQWLLHWESELGGDFDEFFRELAELSLNE